MSRTLLTLAAAVALCGWCSGQGTQAPAPAEQLRMLEANRELLAGLLDHGVKLSGATTPLERAAECREAARTLAGAVEDARSDSTRVAELGGYLADVFADGLAPTLEAARAEIPAGSPHLDTLRQIERDAGDAARAVAESLAADGSPEVARVRERLNRFSSPAK